MITFYIILIILQLVLLVAIIVDWVKHPEDYKETPKPRKKHRRRTNNTLPPFTAWTWWMYAERNSGRFPDSERRREQLRRGK